MIKAECILASQGLTKIATFKVTMPRYILAEFNTHRVFSRNSASSRAIRTEKILRMLEQHPFIPMAWQRDHKGMQGSEYITDHREIERCAVRWKFSRDAAIENAKLLGESDVTKQLTNRLLEPFMYHTVLVTSTEWDNFFNLRCPRYEIYTQGKLRGQFDTKVYKSKKEALREIPELSSYTDLDWLKINKGQADIHMMAVAEAIYDAYKEARFQELKPFEWHVPYGDLIDMDVLDDLIYSLNSDNKMLKSLQRDGLEFNYHTRLRYMIMISVARCARLSYQTLGDEPKTDYLADINIYNKLRADGHWSPFEHVAYSMDAHTWDKCIKTVVDHKGEFVQEKGWLANYRGWVQQRSMLENAVI